MSQNVKKNCLILGAGLMQKPAILSAKELGYNVCVIDADKNAVAIPYADEFKNIDLKDKDSILEYARSLAQGKAGLACVFTAGTDFSANVSYVCEKLGLPAHSYEAALNASIKNRMRECFSAHGVPSPKFIHVTKSDLSQWEQSLLAKVLSVLHFPFVVKPVDNMGARGCRLVRNEKEFLPSLQAAIDASRTQTAILESYMEGDEYSIDALVYDGKFIVTGFAIRHIKYDPYFIEIGHTMPAVLEKPVHDQLISVFALGAKALGLSCGVAKADIKFTKDGPMIGEIAARLSGGYMSGWTYPYASDLNLTKQALLIASGLSPSQALVSAMPVDFSPSALCLSSEKPYEILEVPCKRTCAERAWLSIPGTVENIEDIQDFTDRAVFDILPRSTVSVGGEVDFPRNNVQKCGNIIAVSHDRISAIAAAENAVSNVFITLAANSPRTAAFLQGKQDVFEQGFPPPAFATLSDDELSTICGVIPANKKVSDFIPEVLKKSEYINKQDWNFNTVAQTAWKFDLLRPSHPPLPARKFWSCVMQGGIQGAVYFSDSEGNL